MHDGSSIQAEWVTALYSGEAAKKVIALASDSVGYQLLDSNNNKLNPSALVAFRRIIDGPLPDYLDRVTDPVKIMELERKRIETSGMRASKGGDVI